MQREGENTQGRRFHLCLLGCWELRVSGDLVELGGREQRLLALLALHGRRSRAYVAGTLWPDSTEKRAQTSLRTAVMRTRHAVEGLLDAGRTTVSLAPGIGVDVHELRRVAESTDVPSLAPRATLAVIAAGDLLPGWYDDWVIFERERLQHLRLRALEAMAEAALLRGRADLALEAALEAIAVEPLRESGHLLVVRAHLLAGNRAAAVREYRIYQARLSRELGIAPSAGLEELLRPVLPPQRDPRRAGGTGAPRPPQPIAVRRPPGP